MLKYQFVSLLLFLGQIACQNPITISASNKNAIGRVLRQKLQHLTAIYEQVSIAAFDMLELKQFLDERSMLLRSNAPVDCAENDSVYQEVVNALLANDRISAETRACLRMETPEEYEEVKDQLLEAFDVKATELSELEERLYEEDFEALKEELARTGFFAPAPAIDDNSDLVRSPSSESSDDDDRPQARPRPPERPSDTDSSANDLDSFFPYIEIMSVIYPDDDTSDSENEECVEFLSCDDCEYFNFPNEVSINYEADEANDESDGDEVIDDERQVQLGQSQCAEADIFDKQLKERKVQDKTSSVDLEQVQETEQFIDFLDADFAIIEMNTYGFFKDLTSDFVFEE